MNRVAILLLLLYLSVSCDSHPPKIGIPKSRSEQIQVLVDLIGEDRVEELADRVQFPLQRTNPIPDITTKEEFIAYYPTLFDSTFKQELTSTLFDSTNTIDHYTGFGLLNGTIWLDHDGRIMTVNHHSKQERALRQKLQQEVQNQMHPSVAEWLENVLVCETEKFLVRIDRDIDNKLRYASWSRPKTFMDAPDLVLNNGVREFQGTMGGITYTFQSSNWTYKLDQVDMAESEEQMGLFLAVYENGVEKMRVKAEKTK